MDKFTEAYLHIINESWISRQAMNAWNDYEDSERRHRIMEERKRNNPELYAKSYMLPDVAIATKNAHNDFRETWITGGKSTRGVFEELRKIEENGNSEEELGKQLVLDAFEYWSGQTGDFANKCKEALQSMECRTENVGILAYAIFAAGKINAFIRGGGKNFNVGDRVELTLKLDSTYNTAFNYGREMGYRNSYLNRDVNTFHYAFTSDKYPSITFDVIFSNNDFNNDIWKTIVDSDGNQRNLIKNDVVKISGKVKKISEKNNSIYLNYGKLLEVVSLTSNEEAQNPAESDDI